MNFLLLYLDFTWNYLPVYRASSSENENFENINWRGHFAVNTIGKPLTPKQKATIF